MDFRFANPWFLAGMVLPVLVLVVRLRRGGAAFGAYPLAVMALPRSRGPALLRLLAAAALACGVIALARPQFGRTILEREKPGRDLMLVIDLSYSMTIDDVAPLEGGGNDRLATVIDAARRFVRGRTEDRIGLVFFGSRAVASCPPTFDHATVDEFLTRTERMQRASWSDESRAQGEQGLLGDGTNLGLGIGSALRWLSNRSADGRAIIVVTDGKDSIGMPGWKDPLQAARAARDKDIHVHCIGVGNPNGTRTVHDGFGSLRRVRLDSRFLPDPERLEEIAKAGSGEAFTANDGAALKRVFGELDRLEPHVHHVKTREDYADRFLPWLAACVACAGLALLAEPRLRGAP
jgi:Ca-activated chloride channel family protein